MTAIFIHAGAGFHSHENEKVHLHACHTAALIGMRFLNAGASATEAVVAAIKVLEDKEVTNAGYGSNLCIDGTVECDATIVDHVGRSGACGAAPNIRNPIILAKTVLDKSMQPLTLGRVPPNLLVGKGATEFARENGLEIVPNENMISKSAGHRFLRWQSDISRTRVKAEGGFQQQTPRQQQALLTVTSRTSKESDRKDALSTGPCDEAQLELPTQTSPLTETPRSGPMPTPQPANPTFRAARSLMATIRSSGGHSSKTEASGGDSCSSDTANTPSPMAGLGDRAPTLADNRSSHIMDLGHESLGTLGTQSFSAAEEEERVIEDRKGADLPPIQHEPHGTKRPYGEFSRGDHITDTVGAIAIDDQGRIAAGSSSGGIGMKHSGRLGPAALVGVGSAVIPAHPNDQDDVSVAVVTSGTGEHMATTMASLKCAERLLRNTRQGPMGEDVEEPSDHDAIKSFVLNDFMDHPGVKSMPSTAAIGVLAVKKYRERYYVYFAHNTESFALASMSSTDEEPMCVMSRMGNNPEKCSVGARRILRTP
ncbi:related to asparaginase [Cephalotrichum gorgonifer]|uniref:Related to asparaginase n=1 Tax=Cephalotrichum gorgonifer TaxID=2041049 RepID=A0AAE8SWN3_9PEZI|nr:related to asparaginase [Cephalotrichum gorgonifer]